MLYRSLLILGISLLAFRLEAIQRYQADIDESRWELQESRVRCELKHPIPRYGVGVFVHSAGGELAFEVHVQDPPIKDSVASMLSVPPFWKPGEEKELAQLSLTKGKMPFYVSRDLALRMLYELDAGSFPTLHYKDWADQTEDVYVALSSANFHDVLPRFRQCISGLVPFGVEDLKEAHLLFDFNKTELDKESREQLDTFAEFASQQKNLQIFIEGHADNLGSRRYNQQLSNRRTLTVKRYLTRRGVSNRQIVVKSYGEQQPLANNTSEQGRAQNRRVTVSVMPEVN